MSYFFCSATKILPELADMVQEVEHNRSDTNILLFHSFLDDVERDLVVYDKKIAECYPSLKTCKMECAIHYRVCKGLVLILKRLVAKAEANERKEKCKVDLINQVDTSVPKGRFLIGQINALFSSMRSGSHEEWKPHMAAFLTNIDYTKISPDAMKKLGMNDDIISSDRDLASTQKNGCTLQGSVAGESSRDVDNGSVSTTSRGNADASVVNDVARSHLLSAACQSNTAPHTAVTKAISRAYSSSVTNFNRFITKNLASGLSKGCNLQDIALGERELPNQLPVAFASNAASLTAQIHVYFGHVTIS
jgi:hypothetical protein